MPDTIAPITFIGGERRDTRTGKERYVVRSNDGREFSVWDAAVFNGVMEHLHEQVNGAVYSKQDDRGNWWNTLSALPDLGLKAAPPPQGSGGTQSSPAAVGSQLDVAELVAAVQRIAQAMENLLQFQMERYLAEGEVPEPTAPGSLDIDPNDDPTAP